MTLSPPLLASKAGTVIQENLKAVQRQSLKLVKHHKEMKWKRGTILHLKMMKNRQVMMSTKNENT